MLVFMPKYKHYTAIPQGSLYSIKTIIDSTIDKFKHNDDTVEVFIEDEFAVNYFNNKKLYTFTRPTELQAIYNFDFYSNYIATIESLYNSATQHTLDFKEMEMPDRVLLFKDPDKYAKEYYKLYINRAKDCITSLLNEKKYAIVFTYRGKNDNPIVPRHSDNDGILYIYCDIETGVISSYYSGIWIDSNIINTILESINMKGASI